MEPGRESAGGARRPTAPTPVRRRSFLEVRWRQLRNPPRPVGRAIASSLLVGVVLGLGYLAYDVALTRGATLPGGDLRLLAAGLVVVGTAVGASLATYLFVPLPTGSGPATQVRRTGWSALLGLFAAIPIAYLVLVVVAQIVKPILV
ncbi:MAG: hypothetical protein C4343_07485 [Chloroflexota bacterium]